MNKLFRDVLLLLWVTAALGTTESTANHGDATAVTAKSSTASIVNPVSSSKTTGTSSSSGSNTCPSRTVNYITHTLPRQCLRTDRVPHNATVSVSVTGSAVETPLTATTTVTGSDEATTPASNLAETFQTALETHTLLAIGHEESASSTATDALATESAAGASAEEESESPLDNANFLSFEDWKKQNLAKTGQSPEDIGRAQPVNLNRPRPGINNALDTLGEESEIDLDFTGFGGAAKPSLPDHAHERLSSGSGAAVGHLEGGSILRSKDAGKTCKERTNYASFDCSATILKSNKECKSASSVLVENKDSYMLNTCSAQNKFFILQLCNDIQIDTIVLANYEFFSSSFRHFKVSVSDRYPVEMDKWKDLGTFEARNTRDIQAFLVVNPIIWAKYLRIEFLSHYGTEYYCPVSLLRVHGTTMIEDYRHQEYIAQGELEEATLEAEVLATPAVVPHIFDATAEVPTLSVPLSSEKEQSTTGTVEFAEQGNEPTTAADSTKASSTAAAGNASIAMSDDSGSLGQVGAYEPTSVDTTCVTPLNAEDRASMNVAPSRNVTVSTACPAKTSKSTPDEVNGINVTELASTYTVVEASPTVLLPQGPEDSTADVDTATKATALGTSNATSAASGDNANATIAMAATSQATQTINSTRTAASPPPAQPSTQESFFKSFAKRLSQLESNSTLSLQYIEEQSRILREAFGKVEKRQVTTTTKFLSQLNDTVMADLQGFRQAYDQLWQSTVIELDGQRESYQREMFAMSSRLTMVADELVWQKRMGIVQSTLLLLCLALVLFGRGGNGYLEMPLMQQMINRSKRWEYSEPNSPSPDSRSPVSLFRRKLWRAKSEPVVDATNLTDTDASNTQHHERPDVVIQPPSPPRHQESYEDSEDVGDEVSTDVEKTEIEPEKSRGHKRNRSRRKKKPPNWPQGNGVLVHERVKSPLAM